MFSIRCFCRFQYGFESDNYFCIIHSTGDIAFTQINNEFSANYKWILYEKLMKLNVRVCFEAPIDFIYSGIKFYGKYFLFIVLFKLIRMFEIYVWMWRIYSNSGCYDIYSILHFMTDCLNLREYISPYILKPQMCFRSLCWDQYVCGCFHLSLCWLHLTDDSHWAKSMGTCGNLISHPAPTRLVNMVIKKPLNMNGYSRTSDIFR